MTIVGIFLGVAYVILAGYAIYDLVTNKTVRLPAKIGWGIAIVIFPFVGVLVYLFSHVGAAHGPSIPDQYDSDIELERLRGS
jgi:hypothetical protein